MRYLSVLIHNSIPLAGVLLLNWSVTTLLALFWCDTLVQAILDSVRIVVHRRLTNDPAHRTGAPDYSGLPFRPAVGRGTYLSQHARFVYPFIAVCGVVLVVAYAAFAKLGIALDFDSLELAYGVAAVAVIATTELVIDLFSLRRRSFLWLYGRVHFREIGCLALPLLFGPFVAVAFENVTAALVLLVVVKVVVDCCGVFAEDLKAGLLPAGWDERPGA